MTNHVLEQLEEECSAVQRLLVRTSKAMDRTFSVMEEQSWCSSTLRAERSCSVLCCALNVLAYSVLHAALSTTYSHVFFR